MKRDRSIKASIIWEVRRRYKWQSNSDEDDDKYQWRLFHEAIPKNQKKTKSINLFLYIIYFNVLMVANLNRVEIDILGVLGVLGY
jgi:hypothetical protein